MTSAKEESRFVDSEKKTVNVCKRGGKYNVEDTAEKEQERLE